LNDVQQPHEKELIKQAMCSFKKFEQTTKPSHHMFDSNTCSLALMLEVKPIVDGELEILYKCIYESDETTILMRFSILGLNHYWWLCDMIF
jgi:hypothetical protein